MLGLNRRISIIQVIRTISDSGAVGSESETVLASGVPAAIQAHLLNNLPPPPDRTAAGGIFYRREFKCWISTPSVPGLVPHTTWIIMDEATSEKFRVRAVVDDGGRSHHWELRMENYDG